MKENNKKYVNIFFAWLIYAKVIGLMYIGKCIETKSYDPMQWGESFWFILISIACTAILGCVIFDNLSDNE